MIRNMRKILSVVLFALAALGAVQAAPYVGENMPVLENEARTEPTMTASVKVSGVVRDQSGLPVIGAFVVQKDDAKNGVITDMDGKFSITVPSNTSLLEVSALGYRSVVVSASGDGIEVTLEEDSMLLEETVIVAFGKQKKEAFTGSSATVKSETITQRQIANPLNALNGQVAGLQMVESNAIDGDPTIRIRGIGSINASNSPLIVLDGMPYNGYWTDINPADIESITVLKDAASNALYGARGANGVIMITTKAAGRGRATITFDAKIGVNQDALVDYETIQDPGEYYLAHMNSLYRYFSNGKGEASMTAFNHAYETLLLGSDAGGLGYMIYSVPEGQKLFAMQSGKIVMNPNATLGGHAVDANGVDHLLIPDDWRKEGLRNGLRREVNLNVNGGTPEFQFYGSLGYITNEGLSYGSDYTRISTRFKVDYNARKWLRVGVSSSYTSTEGNYSSGAFDVSHNIAPIYPLYIRDASGNIMTDEHGPMYDWGDDFGMNRAQSAGGLVRPTYIQDNPIQADKLDVNTNSSNAFGVQGYADVSFLKHFKFTMNASVYDTENRTISANNPYYGYYAITGSGSSTSHYRTMAFNTQQLLNWNQTFSGHNFQVLLGHEYTRNGGTTLSASKSKFYSYDRNVELDGSLNKTGITGNSSMYNVEGFFARAQYEFGNRYYASASFRRDGTSRFAKGHKWGNFWSVGGAWIMSKESWFSVPGVDMLKLKASYGSQGNDGIGNFRYSDYFSYDLVSGLPALSFSSIGNEDITWETNGNFNTGVEFELFKGRLNGGIEYYRRKTTDMLLYVNTPASVGFGGFYDNIGDMLNKGVEFELNGSIIRTKRVNWTANFNISHNINRILYLNEDNKVNHHDYEGVTYYGKNNGYKFIGEGLPLNTWYIPNYAGVDQTTGESLWYTSNGGTTTAFSSASYRLSGTSDPVVYGGFGTSLSIGGFDVSMSFLYSVGGLMLDQGYASLMASPYSGYSGQRYHVDVLKGWTPEEHSESIPRFQFGDQTVAGVSDRFLTDASSLTFKNINLGYTLPQKWTKPLDIAKVRLYASCENIWYWSARKGFDPRTSLSGYASYGGYSPIRSISGGINIQF